MRAQRCSIKLHWLSTAVLFVLSVPALMYVGIQSILALFIDGRSPGCLRMHLWCWRLNCWCCMAVLFERSPTLLRVQAANARAAALAQLATGGWQPGASGAPATSMQVITHARWTSP